MAAMITLADPSIAWATGLDGWPSWLAICAADRPARTYWRMSLLATKTYRRKRKFGANEPAR